jgi:hypothetical protein
MSAAAALAMLLPMAASAQSQPAKNKTVFQVSDGDPQERNLTLNNANNVQDARDGGPRVTRASTLAGSRRRRVGRGVQRRPNRLPVLLRT